MPGNSTAVRVHQHASKRPALFKRHCLAALILSIVGTAEAQEEYRLEQAAQGDGLSAETLEKTSGRAGNIQFTIRDGLAIAQGDIVLGRVDSNGRLIRRYTARGLGLNNNFGLWPSGVITYTISDEISAEKRVNIIDAVRQINTMTRISILERTDELAEQYPDNWVNFVDGSACASYVGANAGDKADQSIWVAPQCNTGSVVHEIAHTIGLFHEHTRPDRNQYITVLEDNILEGSEHNFAIVQAGADNYSSYDYGSIMHYGEYFFSTNPVFKKTIEAPNGESIGQREKLSTKDIAAINSMYATDLSLSVDVLESGELQEFDVSVSNISSRGAHRIYARLALPKGGQWVSVSRDSNWDCTSEGEQLNCTRDVLEGGELSRFVLRADADVTTTDDLIVVLQSRTLDTNLSNNAINDDGRWTHLAKELLGVDDNSGEEDGAAIPGIGAGNPQGNSNEQAGPNGTDPGGAPSADGDSSSKGGSGALGGSLVLLGMIAGLRKRYQRQLSR